MTPDRTLAPRWRPLALLALAGLAAAGCGSDAAESASTAAPATAPRTTAAPTTAAPTTAAPTVTEVVMTEASAVVTPVATDAPTATDALPQPFLVEATLDEYTITIPAEIPSGFVRLSATNVGASTHHLELARINDGMSYDEWLQAFRGNEFAAEGMIVFGGGPNGVEPGTTVSAEMNLEPGNYVALDLIPSADGPSEASLGMVAPVTVTPPASGGGEAVDLASLDIEGTVTLTEHQFTVSPGFDGHGRVLVTNAGAQVHELVITRIGDGGSFEEYRDALAAGAGPNAPELQADYQVLQGVAAISPGVSIVADLDLEDGDYVLSCLAPDYSDFLPHTMHGMIALMHVPTT